MTTNCTVCYRSISMQSSMTLGLKDRKSSNIFTDQTRNTITTATTYLETVRRSKLSRTLNRNMTQINRTPFLALIMARRMDLT